MAATLNFPENAHWIVTVKATIVAVEVINVSTAPANLTLTVVTITSDEGHNESFIVGNSGTFYKTYSFLYEGGGPIVFDGTVVAGAFSAGSADITLDIDACKLC